MSKRTRPDHKHFDFIHPRLAVGGEARSVRDFRNIARAGITHVIDARQEWNDVLNYNAHGIEALWLGVDDDGDAKPDWWYENIVAYAKKVLDVEGSKLLTHCAMGINRGPSVMYVVLRAVLGYNAEDAYQMIVSARPEAYILYSTDADLWIEGKTYSERRTARRQPMFRFSDEKSEIGRDRLNEILAEMEADYDQAVALAERAEER